VILHTRYAPPFVFLVTDIPQNYREYLVETAILEVDSPLGVLFVENGRPIPHDYITTLTNYNMKIETDGLKNQAAEKVRRSVMKTLFDDVDTEPRKKTEMFITANRDNIQSDLSTEEARLFVRDSVKVEVLEIIVPGRKILTPVYNIYIHPPTTNEELLGRWRTWASRQKYHAGNHGVGLRYTPAFTCNHCKTVDHPSGLCPHAKAKKGKAGGRPNEPDDDDFFPIEKDPGPSGPGPKPPTPGPSQWKRVDRKGKGKAAESQPKTKTKGSSRSSTGKNAEAKRRKYN